MKKILCCMMLCLFLVGCEEKPQNITYVVSIFRDGSPEIEAMRRNPGYMITGVKKLEVDTTATFMDKVVSRYEVSMTRKEHK